MLVPEPFFYVPVIGELAFFLKGGEIGNHELSAFDLNQVLFLE